MRSVLMPASLCHVLRIGAFTFGKSIIPNLDRLVGLNKLRKGFWLHRPLLHLYVHACSRLVMFVIMKTYHCRREVVHDFVCNRERVK